MNDTSLHTKYRPKTFDEVVGHEDVVTTLNKVVRDKRAKSFLFTGPAGTGKTTLARILANAFAGQTGSQANIMEVAAATHTGVDAMRSVAASAHYRAIGGSPVKAYIVDECHRISGQAWDSLLKPIEEPPAHVYWMFCTTELGKVPKTIQTRCLRVDLKPLAEEHIHKLLKRVSKKEKIKVDSDVLEAIAEHSAGSARQALVYLESCMYCESVAEAKRLMKSAGESKEIIDFARFMLKPRGGWVAATKLLKSIEGAEAESIRIVTMNYLAAVLLGTKSDKEAARILGVMECFETPFNQSDKMAPLLLAIGRAIDL